MNKVLITGVTGYIGGRLLDHLYKRSQYTIYATSSRIPVETRKAYPRVLFYEIDLLSPENSLDMLCKEVDCIIHLAATNEIISIRNPVFSTDLNVLASVRLLETAKKFHVSRFIYLSTAHVYANPLVGHLDESCKCEPRHPYSITHRAVEDFVLTAHKQKEIEGVVLRLSNGFGEPQTINVNRWTLLLNEASKSIVEKKTIIMRSSGLEFRDFITLTDACRGIEFFIAIDKNRLKDGLFNLGGDHTVRAIEMIMSLKSRCKNILGYEPDIKYTNTVNKKKETENLLYDTQKIKEAGFRLEKEIDLELDRLLVCCRNNFQCEALKEREGHCD